MSESDDVVAKFTQLATPTIANALDDVAFEGVSRVSLILCRARAASAAR